MTKLCSLKQFTRCTAVSAEQCLSASTSCEKKFSSMGQDNELEVCLLNTLGLSQQQAQNCFAATVPGFSG